MEKMAEHCLLKKQAENMLAHRQELPDVWVGPHGMPRKQDLALGILANLSSGKLF